MPSAPHQRPAAAFGRTLRRLRDAAGFPSSRRFFLANGGQRFFGCSYRQYLNVEAGSSVPGSRLMEKICAALSLANKKSMARELVMAYLGAIGVSEDLAALVIQALSETPGPVAQAQSPLVQSFARLTDERKYILSTDQTGVIASSFETYWVFKLLSDDKGAWASKDLATTLGAGEGTVRKSLAELAKAGLAEAGPEGRFRCPDAGKVFCYPEEGIYTKGLEVLKRYKDRMAARQGETLLRHYLFLRASDAALRHYLPYLVQSVDGTEVCSTHERGEDTGLYEVEVTARRILRF